MQSNYCWIWWIIFVVLIVLFIYSYFNDKRNKDKIFVFSALLVIWFVLGMIYFIFPNDNDFILNGDSLLTLTSYQTLDSYNTSSQVEITLVNGNNSYKIVMGVYGGSTVIANNVYITTSLNTNNNFMITIHNTSSLNYKVNVEPYLVNNPYPIYYY